MTTVRSLLDRLAAGEVELDEVEREFLDLTWTREPGENPAREEPWLTVYRDLDRSEDSSPRFSEVADAHLDGRITGQQYAVLAQAASSSMHAQMLRKATVLYVFEGGPKDGETEVFRGTLIGNLYYDDRFGDGISRYQAMPRTARTPHGDEAYVLEYRGPYHF